MSFATPCFVRVEDAKERKELIGWLSFIGYTITRLDKLTLKFNPIIATMDNDVYDCRVFGLEFSRVNNMTDCGSNIELFKALAAMNDENDYYQWFVTTLKPEHMVLNNSMDNNRLFAEPLFRKATAEEIVEHFKKRKV